MAKYKPLWQRSNDDVIRIVREDFQASEDDREEKNERNFQAYRMFHCRDLLSPVDLSLSTTTSRDDMVGGRAPYMDLGSIDIANNKTFVPWLRGITLTSVSRLAHGIWPDFNDFYRVDPDDEDDEKAAESAFAITKYFIRASQYKPECLLFLLQLHLFDFAILYTGWKTEYGLIPRPKDMNVQMKDFATGEYHDTGQIDKERREIEMEQTEVSGWDVAAMNSLNFRYDPCASYVGFGEFHGFTALLPKRRMWELVEAGEWNQSEVEKIDEDEPPNDAENEDGTNDMTSRLKEDEHLSGHSTLETWIAKRYVRADFCWTPDSRAVVLNKKAVPLKAQSWRTPFHKACFIPNFGMFSGTSMVEPLIPAQIDINQCLRLVRTQQDRAINPDSVVNSSFWGSVAEAETQPWGTGATIMATHARPDQDMQLARRFIFHPSGTAPDIWNSITLQMQFGEKASGISANTQGLVEGGATATAIRDAANAVDIRDAFVEIGIEQACVIDPIDDLIKLIALNVTEEVRIRIKGKEGLEWQVVKPSDLAKFKKSPDVVALGMSSMASRAIAAQSVRDITLSFLQNPVTGQHLKIVPSMRDVYRLYDINPDTYVSDDAMGEQFAIPPEYVPALLATGKRVPLYPYDDHEAVIQAIVEFVKGPEFAAVAEENKRLILEHVRLRKMALSAPQGGGMAPSPTGEPSGGGGMIAGNPGQGAPGQPPQGPPPVATPAPGPAMPVMPVNQGAAA